MFKSFRPAQETLLKHNLFLSRLFFRFTASEFFGLLLQIIQPETQLPVNLSLLYLFVGQGPGLGLVACGVAAAQRRQVLHDGVQRLLLDCGTEESRKKKKNHTHTQKITSGEILQKDV